MQTKNVVSNNLKEFTLQLESAVKEGYSVVEESVDFHAGYFKVLTRKEDIVLSEPLVEKREEAKQIFAELVPAGSELELGVHQVGVLEFDSVVEVPEGTKMETSEGTIVAAPKPNKRGRK